MAIITKAIKLETTQQNLIQAVIAKQNDCNSRFLKVTFLDEGTVIPLEISSQVTINAERKDGVSKSFFGLIGDDDTATVPLHSWILELDGVVNCDISIIGTDGSKLTTTTFVVKVEKAANSNADISVDPQYDVLANLIEEVSATNKNIHKAANALKGTASGSVVALTDVSPLEHEIGVQLTSKPTFVETVTPLGHLYYDYYDELQEGDYVVSSLEYDGAYDCEVAWIVGGEMMFYGDGINSDTVSPGDIIRVKITHIEADEENGIEEEWIDEFYLVKQEAVDAPELDFSTVTLTRYGENPSDNPQTYTPNADGTVDGVTSLYPSTTLVTDTEGVIITAEYNKDLNKVIETILKALNL